MTIAAKQEWCPLCSMVHEPNLHIHEVLKDLEKEYKSTLNDLKILNESYKAIINESFNNEDGNTYDDHWSNIIRINIKYNV